MVIELLMVGLVVIRVLVNSLALFDKAKLWLTALYAQKYCMPYSSIKQFDIELPTVFFGPLSYIMGFTNIK